MAVRGTEPLESPESLRRRLDYDDQRLRSECVVDTHRVRGPGGQHRNKVESAVRLVHRPSGIVVTGQERRSQHANLGAALRRLREAIALTCRSPLPATITWPAGVQPRDGRLRVNRSNPAYVHVLALSLDAVASCAGDFRAAASRLGVTASSLMRFLARHPAAWREVNRIRAAHALPPLRN